jgi:hypothetical protein
MVIEQRDGTLVLGTPELFGDGCYRCFYEGSNMHPEKPTTLEDVGKFLRLNPRDGVRMTPQNSKIVDNIFMNGILR